MHGHDDIVSHHSPSMAPSELHSEALEFFGRITLETYVLQFHVFMNHDVQHIPVVIPGSGPEGPAFLKILNMLLCGTGFVALAWLARKLTISTQSTTTELMDELLGKGAHAPPAGASEIETKNLISTTSNGDNNEGSALKPVPS